MEPNTLNLTHVILGLGAMIFALLFLSKNVRRVVSEVKNNSNIKVFPWFIMIGAIGVLFLLGYIDNQERGAKKEQWKKEIESMGIVKYEDVKEFCDPSYRHFDIWEEHCKRIGNE